MRGMVLSRRRVLRVLCAIGIVAAALGSAWATLGARVGRYDRWKTHGYALYVVWERTGCYLFLQDWRGQVAGEQVVRFDYAQGQWDIGAVDPQDVLFEDLSARAREKITAFRAEHGVGLVDYVWDENIAECAFYYAEYMAEHNDFSHGADGLNFGDRLDDFDVAWSSAGENLQRNGESSWSAACHETVWGSGGWANSTAGHREAMLGQDPSETPKGWTHAAAGVGESWGQWYVAMYFVKY